jgi:predicted RNA-binding protein with TRAM domain
MERRGGRGFGGGRREGGFGRGGGHREGGFGRGGFGGGDRFDKPKPVKIGEEYDVTITDVGAKGDGITKVENFIVFVNGGKKGEQCRIRIKEVANKFAIADKVGASEGSEESSSEETEESSEGSEEFSESEEKESDEE